MRKTTLITIAAILIATSGFAQTNSTKIDSLENSYVTANDSPDSTNSSLEMTWEEMEEQVEKVIRNYFLNE